MRAEIPLLTSQREVWSAQTETALSSTMPQLENRPAGKPSATIERDNWRAPALESTASRTIASEERRGIGSGVRSSTQIS